MLNVYTSENYIPADMEYVKDNDAFFKSVGFYNEQIVAPIIGAIDEGHWQSTTTFMDRFGITLYSDFISTGAKTLINISSSEDKVFNGCEMGINALHYMFLFLNGNVLLKPMYMFEVPELINISNIKVNGSSIQSTVELEELLCI